MELAEFYSFPPSHRTIPILAHPMVISTLVDDKDKRIAEKPPHDQPPSVPPHLLRWQSPDLSAFSLCQAEWPQVADLKDRRPDAALVTPSPPRTARALPGLATQEPSLQHISRLPCVPSKIHTRIGRFARLLWTAKLSFRNIVYIQELLTNQLFF